MLLEKLSKPLDFLKKGGFVLLILASVIAYAASFYLLTLLVNDFQIIQKLVTLDPEVDFYYRGIKRLVTQANCLGVCYSLLDLLPNSEFEAQIVLVLAK